MTVEELSERILDEGTIMHYDDQEETPANQNGSEGRFVVGEDYTFGETDGSDSLENYGVQPTDDSDSLEHYGVLGMKWGVRKDRTAKVKKRDRRYEGESDQEYQARMNRESQERQAKARYKAEAESQKRVLKSQQRMKKLDIKAQEKQRSDQAKEAMRKEAQKRKDEKNAIKLMKKEQKAIDKTKSKSKPTNARNLTDKELADAIKRLRDEQTYKDLSIENKSFAGRNLSKVMKIGGGILFAVGADVVTKQLTNVGNYKLENELRKRDLIPITDDEQRAIKYIKKMMEAQAKQASKNK